MITGVQVRNVQKSRSGLTRMAKLTFEDLTGSVPAMLWPEEFAKIEALVKDDAIGFVRGTLDRRRDPAELIVTRIIPIERGRRRALARRGRHPAQGGDRGRRSWSASSARSGERPGNLDVYLEILGLAGVRRAIFKAGRIVQGPPRRPPDIQNRIECWQGPPRRPRWRKNRGPVEATVPRPAADTESADLPDEPDDLP